MKKYTMTISVDENLVREASGESDLESAICTEAGWMQESGINVDSIEPLNENSMTLDRAKEMLHRIVDHICNSLNTPESAELLSDLGFTNQELMKEFGFSHIDLEDERMVTDMQKYKIGEKYWATNPKAGRNKQSCGTLTGWTTDGKAILHNERWGTIIADTANLDAHN